MEFKFNSYEYNLIKKFTSMHYEKKCSLVEKIKMRNETSVWHELLDYLLSPNGVLKIYKVEYTHGENNCTKVDLQTNFVVRS